MFLLKFFFGIYRKILSPLLHAFSLAWSGQPQPGCRFVPTCSEYSERAIEKYGLLLGSYKTVVRVCHCHPYSKKDRWDPV